MLVFGTASTERLLEALSSSGRKTRLIGQGSAAGAHRTLGLRIALSSAARETNTVTVSTCAGFDDAFARALGMDLRTLRQSLAAVAEFKGETWNHGNVVGVVRFVQVRACRAILCVRCTT